MAENHNDKFQAMKGFTLVELLISSTLSGLIMLGVMQLFFMTQQAYRNQNAFIHLAESGHYFTAFMRQSISRAGSGFKNNKDKPYQPVAPIIWSMTQDDVLTDTLTVQYVTGLEGGYTCTGSRAQPNTVYISQYTLIPFGKQDAVSQLICRSGKLKEPLKGDTADASKLTFDETGIILSGAEAFSITYGVSTGGDYVEQYLTADTVDSKKHKVLNIEIGLLLKTTDEPVLFGLAKKHQPKKYQLLDQTISLSELSGVHQLRRIFEVSFHLDAAYLIKI